MKIHPWLSLVAFALMSGSNQTPAQNPAPAASKPIKAVRFRQLWDGKGKVWKDPIVIIAGDRIRSLETDPTKIPGGAEIIDLQRFTGIPGLIDVHTHMTFYWDQAPGTQPWAQVGDRMAALTVFLAQENARKTLEAGVTTVRDLGSVEYDDIAMRELINRGAMAGPRMFVAGYGLSVTDSPAKPGYVTPSPGQADGVPEVMRVVRQQIAAGADWIKIYGSTGSGADVSQHQTFTYDELHAAIEVAHKFGKRVAVHSYGPDGAKDAIRAGADSIEHATDLDDATLAEMARRATFYVPTIDHNRYYIDNHEKFGYSQDDVDNLSKFIRRNLETARRAHKAGVPIAMGSDAVFTMFGENTRELGWFVKAGMTPEQALTSATSNAAKLLDMSDSLGAIASGYYADLVAIEGDPVTDIGAVQQVRWVMKAGHVVVNRTKAGNHY